MLYKFEHVYSDNEDALKELSLKSEQIRASFSIKLLKNKLLEYVANYKYPHEY